VICVKIGIFTNESKDINYSYTKKIVGKLSEFSEVYLYSDMKNIGEGYAFAEKDEFFNKCDVIVSLGGDGTLLRAAHFAAPFSKPVLGVNLGRLGFLTGCESEYFLNEGYKKLSGDFKIQERMMIEAEIVSRNGDKKTVFALNDIVVKRADFARMESIDIHIDNELLGNYLADGVIISTPTGSTAYSLSAGGPIADPQLEAMIITPICPHLLRARPIVVPSSKVISFSKSSGDFSAVAADGQERSTFGDGDRIFIRKSENKAKLIKINDEGFYKLLSKKLK